MTSSELRARAAKATGRRTADKKKPQSSPKLTTKTTQLTVTLSDNIYRRLKEWPEAVGLPEKLGRSRIPTVDVIRALIEELFSNAELKRLIIRRITKNLERHKP